MASELEYTVKDLLRIVLVSTVLIGASLLAGGCLGCRPPQAPTPTTASEPEPDWHQLAEELPGKDKRYVRHRLGKPEYESDRVWKYSRPGNHRMFLVYFHGQDVVQEVSK